jgi:hypothetical protein
VKDMRRLELTIEDFEGDFAGEARAAWQRHRIEHERLRVIVRDLAAADPVTRGRIELAEDDFCTLCNGKRPPQPWPDPLGEPPPVVHAPTCLTLRAKAPARST